MRMKSFTGLAAAVAASVTLLMTLGVPGPATAADYLRGRTAVGVEAGLPLVLGIDVTHATTDQWTLGLAMGRLGGLTALRGEARRLLATPAPRKIVPYVAAGAEQYFLKDGDRSATPIGVHAALGLDYHFDSPVSAGVRVGVLKTFGSSGGGDLKVFSVENGFTSGTTSLSLRYHF